MTGPDRDEGASAGTVAWCVALAFTALHLLILWRSPAVINLEESDWGNLAAAYLDGMAWDPLAFQEMDRQGMVQLLGPIKGALYALFGPSFLTLKATSILFAAGTAGLMYRLARRCAPTAPRLETALLCALPAPLVSEAATNAYGPASPFGAAFFLMACLLILLRGEGRRALLAAFLAGLLAGLGIWAGTAFVTLLPALLWVAWRRAGVAGVGLFSLATVPGWSFVVRNLHAGLQEKPSAESLFGLSGISGFLPSGVGDIAWQPLWTGLLYWPGLGFTPQTSAEPQYLAAGAVLSPLILLAGVAWFRSGRARTIGAEAVFIALACWAVALAVSGYEELAGTWRVDPGLPGGLRYCWPWPLLWTLAAVVSAPHLRFGVWLLRGLILAWGVGLGMQVLHTDPPTPWHQVAGYQTVRVRTREWPPELKPGIHPDRQNRYAFWFCQTLPLRGKADAWAALNAAMRELPLDPAAHDECLRGVGMSWGRGRCAVDLNGCMFDGAPADAEDRIWEGLGMSRGCQDPRALLNAAGREHQSEAWWGMGRVELQCKGEWDRRNRRGPSAYIDGWKAGWRLDVAAPGHRDLDPRELPRLKMYNFRWVQGPEFVQEEGLPEEP